jgi:hypothetical protein
MSFLAYFVVLVVAVGSVLFGLDMLTAPLPPMPAQKAIHAAGTLPPQPATAVPRTREDGPNAALSPVYPVRHADPATEAPAPQPAATVANNNTEAASTAAAPPQVNAPVTPQTIQGATAQPLPAALSARAETTGSAPAATASVPATAAPAAPALAQPAATASVQPVAQPQTPAQPVTQQTQNQCDVPACSAAYQSFRASDCSYQPFEGARRLCEKPPESGQRLASEPREPRMQPALRKPNRDAELRDVERSVRQMTDSEAAAVDPQMPDQAPGRVIVIRRPGWRW